jgi:hypothetical protein
MMGYDSNSIIYTAFDDGYNTTGQFYFNMDTGETTEIPGGMNTTFLNYDKGVLYYYTQSNVEHGISKLSVTKHDFNTGEESVLFEQNTTPGAHNYIPVAEGFTLTDNRIYFTKLDDNKEKLFVCSRNSDSLDNAEDMGCVVKKFSAFEYGEVKYVNRSEYCPNCGIPLDEMYYEYFVLSPEFSDAADKINETLKAQADFATKSFDEAEVTYDESECEDHQAYPSQYNVTDDTYVDGVTILQDKYLCIDVSGYWYGGGAHGMPYENQKLFDLETGDEKTLSDFYTGTEDEFKTLIANKTVDDYNSYPEGQSPYMVDDADEIYGMAYESVRLDGIINFAEDGITYSYEPYVMGPYASGYINIFVSYEELLGRNSL